MAYSHEQREKIVTHICRELEKKRSLTKICEEDKEACGMTTLFAWCEESVDFQRRVARAREVRVEKLLEETLEIADAATDDAYIWTDPKTGRQYARLDGSSTKRAALQIATRESYAKMMMPERFAQQRMDVTSGGKALPAPVQQNDNRIVALLTLAAQRAQELGAASGKTIDVTPIALSDVMD